MQPRKPYDLDDCLLIWATLERIYCRYIYTVIINQLLTSLEATTTTRALSILSYTSTTFVTRFKAA